MGIVSVFGQTAPLGNGALLRDGTLESWAGRGEARELVLRMRNRTGAGEGRGRVRQVLGALEAPVLPGSASEGFLLVPFLSFLPPTLRFFSFFPPPRVGAGALLAQPPLLEFRSRPPPLSCEANESETSWVCGHPCSTRLIAALLLALWPTPLWVSGEGQDSRKGLVRQAALSRQSGDVTLLCDTRGSLVTWKPKAEAGGGKTLPGFPVPQNSPILV